MQPVLTTDGLLAAQQQADRVYVDPALIEFAVRLAGTTRDLTAAGLGEPRQVRRVRRQPAWSDQPDPCCPRHSPTSAVATMRSPTDVLDLTHEVFRHRMVLSFEALADGVTADAILDQAVAAATVPAQVAACA